MSNEIVSPVEQRARDRRALLKTFDTLTQLELMLIESKNELEKSKIMDRLFQRMELRGSDKRTDMMRMQNQAKIKTVENTIKDLEDMHSYEFAEKEKKNNNVSVEPGHPIKDPELIK